MGEVYRAKDTRLGREVAIKVLPSGVVADPERLARFEREARAVSALNHPNIVTLHEVGASDSGPYLVLEKIDGRSLRELLGDGPMPVRRILSLATQIAEGLAKAHAAGIVHRDLKPDNVMVTGDGFAKILDFGLAKLVYPELGGGATEVATTLAGDTASGVILGTLGYLSPEQAAGKPADYRADQFALGALIYEMAARERPFRRGTVLESLAATISDEPDPVQAEAAGSAGAARMADRTVSLQGSRRPLRLDVGSGPRPRLVARSPLRPDEIAGDRSDNGWRARAAARMGAMGRRAPDGGRNCGCQLRRRKTDDGHAARAPIVPAAHVSAWEHHRRAVRS